MPATAFYAGIGPALTLYDIDVDGAALPKRSTVTLPANINMLGHIRRGARFTWRRGMVTTDMHTMVSAEAAPR